MPWALEKNWVIYINWMGGKKIENTVNVRFTQGLLQLFFTFFVQKASKWAYNLLQFFISYWKKFQKLIKFITQSYLLLLNSILFLSRFYVSLKSLNNYFFRFSYKSLLNRLPVLIDYIMWSSNHFSISSCFLHFSGSRFFKVQVFQGPGPGSGSRF